MEAMKLHKPNENGSVNSNNERFVSNIGCWLVVACSCCTCMFLTYRFRLSLRPLQFGPNE